MVESGGEGREGRGGEGREKVNQREATANALWFLLWWVCLAKVAHNWRPRTAGETLVGVEWIPWESDRGRRKGKPMASKQCSHAPPAHTHTHTQYTHTSDMESWLYDTDPR